MFADGESSRYGIVQTAMGDRRFAVLCWDGAVRVGCVRGNMKRRTWVRCGDLVLCSVRAFQDDKVDIAHRYAEEEVRRLMSAGQIPAVISKTYARGLADMLEDQGEDVGEDAFDFEDI